MPVSSQEMKPDVRVLRCGRLLDVRTGELLRNQAIVVTGERISAIGPADQVTVPSGAEVIDLSRAVVLPGLIDVHTHLIDDAASYDSAGPLKTSAAQMAFASIPNAQATLAAGFTSVRDLGTYRAFVDVALRDAIDRGIVPGPRIQPAGAYVTISGGAGDLTGFAPDVQLPRELRFGVADGPEQVRQRVREIIRNGAGVVKVLATGAILTLRSQPASQEFTYEELRAAVEEAEKAGLRVACHAHSPAGAKDAIRAGVASIEHGSLLDDETLRMMKEKGVFLVPDIYNDEAIMAGQEKGYPPEFIEKERVAGQSAFRVFRRALEFGVRIAFGTDAAVIPHGTNGRQFAVYVREGMSPLEAIRSATIEAAALIGWEDKVGSLETGKFADIIAVGENPLDRVNTLERVPFVMKGGRVFKNDLR